MTEKNYFDDLTSYTHQIAPFVMDGVKNVGWLDLSKRIPTGNLPSWILRKLKAMASGTSVFQPLVEPLREPATCQICGALNLLDVYGKSLPSSELWIPSDGCIYAAPIAILHYIEFHQYHPPAEYVAAVENLDLNVPFFAEEIYRKKLVECGWFNRGR